MRVNCHVPITLRIVGVPTDEQLAQLGRAVTRAVAARLAEAERVLAERHGHLGGATPDVRERYDPAREDATGYAVPSYQSAGDPVAVPTQPASPAAAPPSAPVPPDLDANEARALQAHSLSGTLLDPTRPAEQNEAAVRAIALEIFGSLAAVDAMFATLSPLVQREVDRQHKKEGPDATTEHRLQFFVRMRLYFDTWHDLLDHFRNFREVRRPATKDSGEVDIVLHRDAADRLERVLNLLGRHPTIYGGFQLRHFEEGAIQTQGFMIHALGFAIDIAAAENPKIGFMNAGARFDPYQIAAAIKPEAAHMDMGNNWPAIVKAMGQRMAADTSTLAADDQDPVAKRIFQLFEQQFNQMRQGSLGFIGTISADHRTKLLDVRTRHLDLLRQLAAQSGRRPVDAKALADLQARRIAVLREIPPLVTEWISALDAEVTRSLARHPGMDRLRPPAEIQADLQHAERNLRQAQQDEQRARAATATAVRRRDAALAKIRPAGRDWSPTPVDALRDVTARRQEADDALLEEISARRRRERAVATRDQLRAELATSDTAALRKAWDWIGKVRDLREELAGPDLSTPAGVAAFEALTTGNLGSVAPADNPPLLRLLEVGFFNPKGAFDLQFFAEMAHSGFVPGATWQFGGADPMHFELQEGRDRIRPPGTLPPR